MAGNFLGGASTFGVAAMALTGVSALCFRHDFVFS